MNYKTYQSSADADNKTKSKVFWKNFGIICLAVFMAAITVLVINL